MSLLTLLLPEMSINVQQLSLNLPKLQKVSDNGSPNYRANLRHFGRKVFIKTPEVELTGLHLRKTANSCSILTPIDGWTREQLNKLETFVQGNVIIPEDVKAPEGQPRDYRSVWPYAVAFITCSPWCKYFWGSRDNFGFSVKPEQLTLPGLYSFTIEAPYVYIGPHKGGERYSLVLRIVEVNYKSLSPMQQRALTLPEPEDETKVQSLNQTPKLPNAITASAKTIPVHVSSMADESKLHRAPTLPDLITSFPKTIPAHVPPTPAPGSMTMHPTFMC